MDRDESVRSILKSNKVLTIFQNYDFQVGQPMHKAVYNELTISLQNILSIENPFIRSRNCRLKQTQKSVSVAGPKICNEIQRNYFTQVELQFLLAKKIILKKLINIFVFMHLINNI